VFLLQLKHMTDERINHDIDSYGFNYGRITRFRLGPGA
jgi:hypothetical protein